MDIAIRLLEEADLEGADRVIRSAFGRMKTVQPMLRLHRSVEPGGFWVAEDRGRTVGTVGATDYGKFAYVALMAVDPSAQRRGIARKLINHVLQWLDRRGCSVTLLDATDAGAPLYQTVGFVDDHTAYEFERDSPGSIGLANSLVQVAGGGDLHEIAAFDASIFGADRRKLLHAIWPENRDRCLIARDRTGQLEGYLFVRDPVVGPWVALNSAAARDLLAAALAFPFEQSPQVLVPRSNQLAVQLLEHFGFAERRRLRHMRRGGDVPPGRPIHLYGQFSFGHG